MNNIINTMYLLATNDFEDKDYILPSIIIMYVPDIKTLHLIGFRDVVLRVESCINSLSSYIQNVRIVKTVVSEIELDKYVITLNHYIELIIKQNNINLIYDLDYNVTTSKLYSIFCSNIVGIRNYVKYLFGDKVINDLSKSCLLPLVMCEVIEQQDSSRYSGDKMSYKDYCDFTKMEEAKRLKMIEASDAVKETLNRQALDALNKESEFEKSLKYGVGIFEQVKDVEYEELTRTHLVEMIKVLNEKIDELSDKIDNLK